MSELKGKTVKIGEGRIMFHYGEAEPTDTEYEIVFTIVQCKDCKYWQNHGKKYPTYCVRPDLIDLYKDDYGVEMDADDFCSRGKMKEE